jgi:hypothetical protein
MANGGGPQGSAGGNYYDAKSIWGQEAINNQAGADA